MIVCKDCFIDEKMPIIYCTKDFEQVVADNYLRKNNKVKFMSVHQKIKLIEKLKEYDGDI